MRLARFLCLMSVLILCVVPAGSQEPPQCLHGASQTPEQQQRAMQAVNVVRMINTEEVYFQKEFGRYASIAELGNFSGMKKYENKPGWTELYKALSFAPGKDILPGIEARLTTNGDKYTVFLVDKTDTCRWSLYSDQEGVIYVAQVMR